MKKKAVKTKEPEVEESRKDTEGGVSGRTEGG